MTRFFLLLVHNKLTILTKLLNYFIEIAVFH